MAILGAAAGVGYEATATVLGAVGHAMGMWAGTDHEDDDTEVVHMASRSQKPTPMERNPKTAHMEMLKGHLKSTENGDEMVPDSGGASSSSGPAPKPPRRKSGRSGGP